MKRIVKRRKAFRINNPVAFGILCAMILVLIGGGVYALAAGWAVPGIKRIQAAYASPSPTPESTVSTPTPGVVSPTPRPTEEITPTPESKPLAAYTIGIDPARGYKSKIKGSFSGVFANRLNYTIALMIKSTLEEMGATVIIPLPPPEQKGDMDSAERAKIFNEKQVDMVIRVECNFADDAKTRGALMWTSSDHGEAKKCDRLANAVLAAYVKSTGLPVSKYKGESIRHKNDETILNNVNAPVCTLIMGYISNREDDTSLNDKEFQAKMVNGIVTGILTYLGVKR